ncbi:MAG: hypothetical protein M1833_007034 [Piccolia ochrophora]|nr:MAG: hypothetical protein M1833_007034 [Piccolia ochrophora]
MAEDEEAHMDSQPLWGAVLCCTAISPEQRTELSSQAVEMGAIHKLDLTSDVTHLIVGNSNTPKYKYVAKERPDVKVLTPQWIDAVRQTWMAGEETDITDLEEKHRLPALSGLKICLTGFDLHDERQKIQQLISTSGAEYHGDLTRNVTHLVAFSTESTKYKFATAWDVHVVSLEWLRHSLERGMILEESLYHPLMPREERGKGAWTRRSTSNTSTGKRARENEGPRDSMSESVQGRRKLRRTTSSKLQSQNSGIWNDIVGGGFIETSKEEDEGANRPMSNSENRSRKISPRRLVLDLVSPAGKENAGPKLEPHAVIRIEPSVKRGMFNGRVFFLNGFDQRKTRVLKAHLLSHDAELSSSMAELSQATQNKRASEGYLMIPHDSQELQRPQLPCSEIRLKTVTEWWLERCLYRKRVIDPDEDVASQPLRYPIKGFEKLRICSTGFSGVDLLHICKLVQLLGATYDEYLSPSVSILICNTSVQNKDKMRHAFTWNVPAASAAWLWDCIKDGKRMALADYLIDSPPSPPPRASDRSRKPMSGTGVVDPKTRTPPKSDDSVARTKTGTSKKPSSVLSNSSKGPSHPSTHVTDDTLATTTAQQTSDVQISSPSRRPASIDSETLRDSGLPLSNKNNAEPQLRSHADAVLTSAIAPSANSRASSPTPSTQPPSPPSPPPASLKTTINALLAQTHSAAAAKPAPPSIPRRTLLGRAPSNPTSMTTTITTVAPPSRASSVDSVSRASDPLPRDAVSGGLVVVEPSQKVVYDDPDAQEQRERLVRKLGGVVGKVEREAGLGRVRSIGVVKDVGGVGTRTRGREKVGA